MAAALIPLALSLAPEIINLIASLVHQHAPVAEQQGSTGTGPVKFADVFVDVMKDLTSAHAQGQIAILPDDGTVKTIIQAVVTSMKLSGLLDGSASAATAAIPLTLKAGQTLTITAG